MDKIEVSKVIKLTTPAPFLRWAGGKRSLAVRLTELVPQAFDSSKSRFFEPFVGGGAVTFHLSNRVKGSKIVINDVNPDLISAYRAIRDDLDGLTTLLSKLAKDTSTTAFTSVKQSAPATDLERAARFIFLNKTCFNGLWRVNSKGEFNVPFGKITNPLVLDKPLLTANSEFLQGSVIRLGSYVSAVSDAKSGDFVYLDPPYIPLTTSSSFSKYAKDDFTELDQYALAGLIRGLKDRGVNVILSNSDTPLTRKIFGGILELRQVSMTRSISAGAASRNKVNEVIGVSFPIAATKISEFPLLVEREI